MGINGWGIKEKIRDKALSWATIDRVLQGEMSDESRSVKVIQWMEERDQINAFNPK